MSNGNDSARTRIAGRIARELRAGQTVNLGVGIPTLIPDYLPVGHRVYIQSENGLLGMGPTARTERADPDLISASKHPVTLASGASLFSSAESFAMIRGGHVDVAVLGALQVSGQGEIANWSVPGEDILGVGGAMDLVAGAKMLIAALTHTTKDGRPKIVKTLSYPSSGIRLAEWIVTEKGVFTVTDGILVLREVAADTTVEELRRTTGADFEIDGQLMTMQLS